MKWLRLLGKSHFPVIILLICSYFLPKCSSKSRASGGGFQYRRVSPGVSSWRGYGGTFGGVLGGVGGESGDLSAVSYRSSRDTELDNLEWGLRPSREVTSYWGSYYGKPATTCEYSCADGTCLSEQFKCDGYAQCWDGSDEKDCTCRERTPQSKICDGYKDCPGGEDEVDCVYGCPSTDFTCDTHNSGSKVKCVAMSKLCDGYNDCPQGNDEHDCFRLVDLNDDEQRGVMSKGILQKRLEDKQWHTVCKTAAAAEHIKQFAEKACEQIVGSIQGPIEVKTKSLSLLKLKMTYDQVKQLKYVRLASIEAKFAVLGACSSDLVYEVTCPPPQCGGEYEKTEEYRRRRRRSAEKEEEEIEEGEVDETDYVELIVGGYASKEREWPFLVAIYRDGEFYCGGSIVNPEWILTAAHCTHGYEKHVYEVQAGMTRRLSYSPYEQSRMVTEIVVHESYNQRIFANDIALFKLDRPLHYSKYVTPSCLPSGPTDDPAAEQMCRVAGWGDLSESGEGPDYMQQVELPIYAKCRETFTRDTHQICAGYPEGKKDACQGDSGGPLMCFNYEGKPIVSGVVSFGRGCARANEAGAYTRVSAYLTWIEEIIQGTKPSMSRVYTRQCTEKCYKGGGECIFPGEKCSGTVECYGAEDELSCTHLVTRTHEDLMSTPGNNYYPSTAWGSYPPPNQQIPYAPQPPYGMISRMKQTNMPTYPIMVPVSPQVISYQQPPSQPSYFPFLLGRGGNHRTVRKTSGPCQLDSEFECTSKESHSKMTECIKSTLQCDRTPQCSDRSDENNCDTVTTTFREPVHPSTLTQTKEVKGYLVSRQEGNQWLPLVTNSWTSEMGQSMCQKLMNSKSAQLISLETISIQDLAKQVQRQTGHNLMQGQAVKMEKKNANKSTSSTLMPSTESNPMVGQMSKINLNDFQKESLLSGAHLNEHSRLMAGFVWCNRADL